MNSSKEDWEIAQDLLSRNKTRHGLFFAHLALEKALKAQVCRTTKDVAPRIHALLRLAERADLDLTEETKTFLAEFDRYQLEGRYPENLMEPPDVEEAQEKMARAKEIYKWLTKQS